MESSSTGHLAQDPEQKLRENQIKVGEAIMKFIAENTGYEDPKKLCHDFMFKPNDAAFMARIDAAVLEIRGSRKEDLAHGVSEKADYWEGIMALLKKEYYKSGDHIIINIITQNIVDRKFQPLAKDDSKLPEKISSKNVMALRQELLSLQDERDKLQEQIKALQTQKAAREEKEAKEKTEQAQRAVNEKALKELPRLITTYMEPLPAPPTKGPRAFFAKVAALASVQVHSGVYNDLLNVFYQMPIDDTISINAIKSHYEAKKTKYNVTPPTFWMNPEEQLEMACVIATAKWDKLSAAEKQQEQTVPQYAVYKIFKDIGESMKSPTPPSYQDIRATFETRLSELHRKFAPKDKSVERIERKESDTTQLSRHLASLVKALEESKIFDSKQVATWKITLDIKPATNPSPQAKIDAITPVLPTLLEIQSKFMEKKKESKERKERSTGELSNFIKCEQAIETASKEANGLLEEYQEMQIDQAGVQAALAHQWSKRGTSTAASPAQQIEDSASKSASVSTPGLARKSDTD